MIAEVIINNNSKELNRSFDYNVPIQMQDCIKLGSRVLVPFGNMKKLEGYKSKFMFHSHSHIFIPKPHTWMRFSQIVWDPHILFSFPNYILPSKHKFHSHSPTAQVNTS